MRYHHTKNKGDLGLVQAMADLAEKGWSILVPLTEHEAFDLVAHRDGRFLRVQVKYRKLRRGCVEVHFKSIWADRRGNHYVPIDREAIDCICIYCPETGCCYYVDPKTTTKRSICLRIEPSGNNVSKGVVWAKDFMEIPRTIMGVAAGSRPPLERMPLVRHSREPRAAWLSSAHSLAG